jgi:hypothetical protein
MELDAIAQCRLDAWEVGEIDCQMSTEQAISAPGRELREYRFDLDRARRRLVRQSIGEAMAQIDSDLRMLKASPDYSKEAGSPVGASEWQSLKKNVDALAMMLGKDMPRRSRWSDLVLQRHFPIDDFRGMSHRRRMVNRAGQFGVSWKSSGGLYHGYDRTARSVGTVDGLARTFRSLFWAT